MDSPTTQLSEFPIVRRGDIVPISKQTALKDFLDFLLVLEYLFQYLRYRALEKSKMWLVKHKKALPTNAINVTYDY